MRGAKTASLTWLVVLIGTLAGLTACTASDREIAAPSEQASETTKTADEIEKPADEVEIKTPISSDGHVIPFADLLHSLDTPAGGNRLSEVELKRALATAKILAAAQAQYVDPGKHKLITREGGEEVWQSRGEIGEFGGTLTVSIFGGGPKTFNVWEAHEVPSHGIGLLMWEPLVDKNAWTGEMYPRLARTFSISDDNLEYTFVLRKGLRWSDGRPVTADDVVFTFDTLVRNGFGNSSNRDIISVNGHFPEVEKIDELSVKFRTKEPFAPFLHGLYNIPVAPMHVLKDICDKPMEEFHGFWDINCDPETLVVSGPFKVKRYVAGQRIEMVRNPHFSMVDSNGRRLPYLDKFVEVIVPDQTTQILKFYGKELDFLDIRSVRGIDAALMKQKESTDDFTMYNLGPDDGTTFMIFNMCRRKNPETGEYYVPEFKQKWFNNLNFRKAVSHAIDRQRMVDNILKGVGLPIYAHLSAGSPWFNARLKPYGQNMKLARSLLARGGFVKKGERLFDSDGNPVEFMLQTNAGNTARDATCVMIQNDLKSLGIKVNYQPIDFNILIDKLNHSLEWESCLMGLTGNKIEPYDSANVWKSDGRLHMFDQRLPDDKGNIVAPDARTWEKRIDECFNKGATTFDTKKRHEYFDRYQKIVYDKVPFIYLYSMLDITAARNKIGNYRPTPIGIYYPPKGTFHNIEEIYIKGGLR